MHLRWFRVAKWGVSAVFGVAAAVGLVDQFWGPIWPTAPDIEVGAPSSDGPFSVPFEVKNKSVLFPDYILDFASRRGHIQAIGDGNDLRPDEPDFHQ